MAHDTTTEGYQTVERAFGLLEAIATGGARGVTELSQTLRLEKSNVSRMLKTLSALGYVVQSSRRGPYQLGPRVLFLADRFLDAQRLVREARPILRDLADRARASAHLARNVGGKFVIVAKEASPERIQVSSEVGGQASPHASAMGKVLLAALPVSERDEVLAQPLERFTAKTLTDRTRLDRALEAIRKQDYALESEEEHVGVGCMGAPVRDARGNWIAAISLSGPLHGTPFALDRKHINLLQDAARILSTCMGYAADLTASTSAKEAP